MKKIGYFFYGIFLAALGTQIWYAIDSILTFTTVQKISIVAIQVISLLLANLFLIHNTTYEEKKNRRHFLEVILFFIFVVNLSYLLFFDPDFGRTSVVETSFFEYFMINVNLMPFATIKLYLQALETGVLSWATIVINLLGNIVIFSPFSYFLPRFFKSQRHLWVFVLTMGIMISMVEVLQVITRSGTGDIDDLILNLSGAVFLYLILYLPPIRKRLWR